MLKSSNLKILQITYFSFIIILFINCKRSSNDFNVSEIEINKNTRGVTYLYGEKPITGLIFERNDSDAILKEYEVKFYLNGKLEGISKSFYEDGSAKEILTYSNGLLTGERSYYWPNGLLKESNQFERGIMTGQSTYFFSNGQIQKKFELDQYGKKHGLWEDYYSNGQLKETSKYKNGEIILEKVRYDEEGKIIQ